MYKNVIMLIQITY